MLLSRTTACQKIEVWSPRWHDRVALIATFRVGVHNEITFPKAKSLPGTYYLSGETIRSHPQASIKGTVMYAVPLSELTLLEREN